MLDYPSQCRIIYHYSKNNYTYGEIEWWCLDNNDNDLAGPFKTEDEAKEFCKKYHIEVVGPGEIFNSNLS